MIKSIYIHIPFCISKCGYCDFFSVLDRDHNLIDNYLTAVDTELKNYEMVIGNSPPIETIFIGGGTPTCLESIQLQRLIGCIKRHIPLAENYEFTVESNPGTLTHEKLSILRSGGVNRLSLGVQSFQTKHLKILGRTHTVDDVFRSIEMALTAGFDNLNLDLMLAIPHQTVSDLESDLSQAIGLKPAHVAVYNLTFEEGTPFYQLLQKNILTKPDDELEAEMYTRAIEQLTDSGYHHYEISNFARPGWECRHNLTYWNYQDYLGIGAAAHSFVAGERWANCANVTGYIDSITKSSVTPYIDSITKSSVTPVFTETLSRATQMSEMMFLGLRQLAGVSSHHFFKRFRTTPQDVFREIINRHVAAGKLHINQDHIRLTPTGLMLADTIFADFMGDHEGTDVRLSAMRREYTTTQLDDDDPRVNPMILFQEWLADARAAGELEPNAMTLATVSSFGQPSARMVLLKLFDINGFTFFTNYHSRKGREIEHNSEAALVFWWPKLERQVRIEGRVQKLPQRDSDRYFAERPRGSQLSARASAQSQPITSRQELEDRLAEEVRNFADQNVSRPGHWGGYRVLPRRMEFWQGRSNRLHDRLQFDRLPDGGWQKSRLCP